MDRDQEQQRGLPMNMQSPLHEPPLTPMTRFIEVRIQGININYLEHGFFTLSLHFTKKKLQYDYFIIMLLSP